MTRTRAAICHAFGEPLSIEEVNLRAPGVGEVEVKLKACAICHSDISYIDGAWGGQLPAVYGHEAAGHVSAIGPGVTDYAVGDTVIVTLIRACGTCESCSSGVPTLCFTPRPDPVGPITTPDGEPVQQAMNAGAFAGDVVVHHSQLAPIPADMAMDAASLLSCGVITGVGAAVNTANLRAGQNVVVIGAGGVGLNAIQGARIAGANRIVAVDLVPEKLEIAKEFGATDGVLASVEKPWRAANKITDGAHAVLVTVGAIAAYETATRYLRAGGQMIMVGMPHTGAKAQYEPVVLAAVAQGMKGTKMGDVVLKRDIPWMVDLYGQGRLKLDELISGRWTLDQINEAIADTRTGAARRNVIVFE